MPPRVLRTYCFQRSPNHRGSPLLHGCERALPSDRQDLSSLHLLVEMPPCLLRKQQRHRFQRSPPRLPTHPRHRFRILLREDHQARSSPPLPSEMPHPPSSRNPPQRPRTHPRKRQTLRCKIPRPEDRPGQPCPTSASSKMPAIPEPTSSFPQQLSLWSQPVSRTVCYRKPHLANHPGQRIWRHKRVGYLSKTTATSSPYTKLDVTDGCSSFSSFTIFVFVRRHSIDTAIATSYKSQPDTALPLPRALVAC